MRISNLVLLLGALALTGAGCLGFGGSSSGGADGGVFKTLNAGSDWAQRVAIPGATGVGSIGSTDVIALALDPQDNLAVYAGTQENGLLYSLDGAATWQQVRNAGLKEGTVSSVAADPTDVCTVYVAKGQRLYKTDDCMRSFSAEAYVETRANVVINEVAVDWYDHDIVWLGLSNGDVLKSEDGSATWRTATATKQAITGLLVSNADSRVVLVSTDGEGFFKTVDSGATWTQLKDNLKQLRNADKVTALVQDEAGTTLVAATAYGLIRSKDLGATWEAPQLLSSPGQVDIYALAVDPDDANSIVYAAGTTFYRSADGGAKWTTTQIPSTRVPVAMLMDPTDASVVYLGVATLE